VIDDATVTRPPAASDDPAAAEPTTEPSGRRAGFVLAVTLAVVGAVVAAAPGLVLAARDSGDPRTDDVRRAAGTFGAALVTYDHRAPEVHRDRVLELATGSFRSEYEDAFDQGLAEIITEVEAVSEGFVDDVYVSAIDEERAEAIVVVDIEHQGTGGARSLTDVYFLLALVEVDGRWKVDQVTDLNFDAAAGGTASPGPADPGAPDPTTTSVP
jgi:Mce-associated membrane protein